MYHSCGTAYNVFRTCKTAVTVFLPGSQHNIKGDGFHEIQDTGNLLAGN